MPRRLRLLCVGRDLRPGGAERVHATLLRHLDPSRISVDVHYMSGGTDLASELPAHVVPRFGGFGRLPRVLATAGTLGRLIMAARKSDLIFAMQEGSPIYLATVAGAAARKPVVGWIHIGWSRMLRLAAAWHAPASRLLYSNVSRMICVSEGVRRDLELEALVQPNRLAVLPNPLDLERIHSRSLEPPPLPTADILCDGAVVACGRLVWEKGFDLLLDAFARCTARLRGNRLLLLGDGPERGRIEDHARQLGLDGQLIMPGHLANPYPIMRRAGVFVLSSRLEGLGMVLLEAMALGVPVVALDSEGGGPREILGDRDCGLLLERQDPGRLAEAIDRILGDRALAERLRIRGRERSRDFGAAQATLRFESLFRSVADDARPYRT